MTHNELLSIEIVLLIVAWALLYLAFLTVRSRRLLGRPGGIPLAIRGENEPWRLGVGRYAGDELLWYGAFRPGRRPTRTLRRGDLEITGQRGRRPAEPMLAVGSVVVECRVGDELVSLALTGAAVTGFLSWLESSPPRSRP